jgi:hypothetical protein
VYRTQDDRVAVSSCLKFIAELEKQPCSAPDFDAVSDVVANASKSIKETRNSKSRDMILAVHKYSLYCKVVVEIRQCFIGD